MTNIAGIVTEDIRNTIAVGQSVFDAEGKKVGWVDAVYDDTGYFMVELRPSPKTRDNPFEGKFLYVPFRLITTIDPRELFVSVTNDELRRDYANPPARSTLVVDVDDKEIATTTERSGFTGAPIVVEQVRIDQLKERIAVGDRVFTAEMTDLGKIKQYDPVTGWMLVKKGAPSRKHDLMIPVTLVENVSHDVAPHEVYLVASQADLQGLQHLEPAYVVFAEATFRDDR